MYIHITQITVGITVIKASLYIFLIVREAWQHSSIFLPLRIESFYNKWSLEYAPYLNKNGGEYTLWQ